MGRREGRGEGRRNKKESERREKKRETNRNLFIKINSVIQNSKIYLKYKELIRRKLKRSQMRNLLQNK